MISNNKIYTRKRVGRGQNQGSGGGCASEQWGKEGEGRRDRAGNGRSTPPAAGGGRSQPPAGANGEPVPGRRDAGSTGTSCRAGAAAAGASAAQLRAAPRGAPGAPWVRPRRDCDLQS